MEQKMTKVPLDQHEYRRNVHCYILQRKSVIIEKAETKAKGSKWGLLNDLAQ